MGIPHDCDSFLESEEVAGFRIWNSWLGLYEQKAVKSVARGRLDQKDGFLKTG